MGFISGFKGLRTCVIVMQNVILGAAEAFGMACRNHNTVWRRVNNAIVVCGARRLG